MPITSISLKVRFLFFFLTATSLGFSFTAQASSQIEALQAQASSVQYSNGAFLFVSKFRFPIGAAKYPPESYKKAPHDFPKGTTIGNLTDKGGNLLLFRMIGQPYVKGFDNGTFIKSEFNSYSYTVSPAIAMEWNPSTTTAYILISIQNCESDGLFYHYAQILAKGEKPPRLPRVTVDQIGGETIAHIYPDVLPNTIIEQIGSSGEVKVPIARENVVAILPRNEFKRIISQFGRKPFNRNELLMKIQASPLLEEPGR